MLLAVIAKMDKENVETDVEKLAELGKFFKTHVEYMLENLLDEGLIDISDEGKTEPRQGSDKTERKGSNGSSKDQAVEAENSMTTTSSVTIKLSRHKKTVEVHDFAITRKGLLLLDEKKKELSKLSVAMQRLYNSKNRDELYRAIFWNREWIALMLYTGVLTTDYLNVMMKFLGLDLYRLSMTESQEALDGLGIDPGLLSMGMVLAHPLLAIASYIISMVAMNKLEATRKPEKAEKHNEAAGKVEGDIYFPKND
jgi:hypothetical protein